MRNREPDQPVTDNAAERLPCAPAECGVAIRSSAILERPLGTKRANDPKSRGNGAIGAIVA